MIAILEQGHFLKFDDEFYEIDMVDDYLVLLDRCSVEWSKDWVLRSLVHGSMTYHKRLPKSARRGKWADYKNPTPGSDE